jgi:ketosteroid isomerase-like protein
MRSLVPNQRQRDARVHGEVSAQRCRELRFGCDHPGIGEERLVSAEQNIATVKAIYDAFGRGDVEAILEQCTDDVDWATDSALEVAPWHGAKHGKAEVPSFFAAIAETGPVTEFTPLSFTSNDDGDVMVFIRYAFTVTATGKDVAMNLHHYWRFRDAKVAYVRASEDTALVAAALSA